MCKKPGTVKTILSILLTVSIFIGITPVSAVSVPDTFGTADIGSYDTEGFKVPDIIDEEERSVNAYIGRLKEDENDLYTFIFKNEDGSNTMRVFDHPVKYVDNKGETRDISLEISTDNDGSFKAADHMINTSFGNDLSEGIGLEYDDVRIEMTARAENSKLDSSAMSLQSHAEVHKQYIQMGPFSFSNIIIKNSSGSWISNTVAPYAYAHYGYSGNSYNFTVYGPVD